MSAGFGFGCLCLDWRVCLHPPNTEAHNLVSWPAHFTARINLCLSVLVSNNQIARFALIDLSGNIALPHSDAH